MSEDGPDVMARFLGPENVDNARAYLHQVAVYAGVPAANRAFAIAHRVLADTSG